MRTESVDVCIIGSGAAGALMAYEAARRGLSVLVLERGPYVRTDQMSFAESEMIPRLYKDGGLQTNRSLDVFILQGSCVGGSSVLANMVMLRPERHVLEAWNRQGAGLDLDELTRAFDRVDDWLGVDVPPLARASATSRLFARGAAALGIRTHPMAKALGACRRCGACNIGCAFGAKRSALVTFVPWAEAAGARIQADTTVTRIQSGRGPQRALVEAVDDRGTRLRVRAERIVVAAGAIGSSAVLLGSRLGGPRVGHGVSFNLGASVVAEMPRALDSYDADQMNVWATHEGALFEATHNPVLTAALTTPGWQEEHGALMAAQRRLAYAGALVPTPPSGRVVRSRWSGHEEVEYRAGAELQILARGLATIGRIFFAAGATRVVLPTRMFRSVTHERCLAALPSLVRSPRDLLLGSAHPQGGNALSDDPGRGVVRRDFSMHHAPDIFVCDASVFPASVGVNPIATVMALASYAANGMFGAALQVAS